MRTSQRRSAMIGGLVLAAGLLLSGCGTQNVAARVDGRVITQQQVRVATDEINRQFEPQQPYTEQDVLARLIVAPTVIEAAAAKGESRTPDTARTLFTKIPNPSDASVLVAQENFALGGLKQGDVPALLNKLSQLDVIVSPRYGAFDLSAGQLKPLDPEWITPAEPGVAPSPTPTP